MDVVSLKGAKCLRHALVLSTLSGKTLRVEKIRETSERPGLAPRDRDADRRESYHLPSPFGMSHRLVETTASHPSLRPATDA